MKRRGNRYLAGLVILFSILFLVVGTLGPAHRSPYYYAIVPLPGAIALFLGWSAWKSRDERSTALSASALVLLLLVLLFSHLLPRSHP
ncbi:MAG TPA: hypothetical protein VHE36_00455 [Sphingomicrobium sp.]|nr:hypothetical protein [Sphingomicrobium sp.]